MQLNDSKYIQQSAAAAAAAAASYIVHRESEIIIGDSTYHEDSIINMLRIQCNNRKLTWKYCYPRHAIWYDNVNSYLELEIS